MRPRLFGFLLLGGCAAPLTPDALVLIDQDAREAGIHVVSEGRPLTGPLPMAVPGGLPLQVVTDRGSVVLDPLADEVVDVRGPDADIGWRRIDDDVDPNALWVEGSVAALEDLAWELDADLLWDGERARLEGPQVLIDAAHLDAPDALTGSAASGFVGQEAVWADAPEDRQPEDLVDTVTSQVASWTAAVLGDAARPIRIERQAGKPVVPTDALVHTTSGAGFVDTVVGDGRVLTEPSRIRVHYTMWVDDDGVKDSSHRRGQPAVFPWRTGSLIQGWEDGLVGMREGGHRILVVPPEAGYGPRGRRPLIQPDSVLTFEVELLAIEPTQ